MNPSPRVTIGMPVCNGQDTLEDAINAILAQTFVDFELIISDCASTDRTEVICQSYAARDPRIRYVRNPVPMGAAGSYNRLVDLARGEYFKWVAHDDLIEPDYLEQCVAALDSDPGIVLAYARSQWIDARGHVVQPDEDRCPLMDARPSTRFAAFLRTPGLCNPAFGLVRLDALRRTARIAPYRASGQALLGHLALLGKFYEVPAFLFYRRMRGTPSGGAGAIGREAPWIETSSRRVGLSQVPRWRWVLAYHRQIFQTPMSPLDRARCLYTVARHLVFSRRWWRVEWAALKQAVGVASDDQAYKAV